MVAPAAAAARAVWLAPAIFTASLAMDGGIAAGGKGGGGGTLTVGGEKIEPMSVPVKANARKPEPQNVCV